LQDIGRAALVRGLTQVLLQRGLTRTEKPHVAALLEPEIRSLVAEGRQDDVELAKTAVELAVEKYRASQRIGKPRRKYMTATIRRQLAARTGRQRQAV
jgi:hypothetical protein